MALKPRGDITRNPKHGYQWPHKKGLKSSKNFKKACMFADESVPSPGVEGSAAPHVRVGARDPRYPCGLRRASRRAVQTPVPVRAMELLVSTQGQHTEKRSGTF